MAQLLYDGSDNVLRLLGAYTIDVASGGKVYLGDDATVEVTLLDLASGDEIVGDTWPMALAYVAGSQGDFIGVLRDGLTLSPGQALTAVVTADNGTDQYGRIEADVLVVSRRV